MTESIEIWKYQLNDCAVLEQVDTMPLGPEEHSSSGGLNKIFSSYSGSAFASRVCKIYALTSLPWYDYFMDRSSLFHTP